MRLVTGSLLVLALLVPVLAFAQTANPGPADALWPLYKEGRFQEVVTEGKALLADDANTAQVNLAVGRSLVDLERFSEALPFLQQAVALDPDQTWVFAWAQVYLGAAHLQSGDDDAARQAWRLARDCHATRNATRNAESQLKFFGLSEFFDAWQPFETEHFSFRFSGRLKDFDRVKFARRHEKAYAAISKWFGGGPDRKIRFFLWAEQQEADEAGMPVLGFSRPTLYVTHALLGQTVGHEMTHIISFYALEPSVRNGLINEGVAVYLDQTHRDQLQRARRLRAQEAKAAVRVSIPAVWQDWSLAPESYGYPLAGAWVKLLVDKGGKKKFFEFFTDQSYAHAQEVYGDRLADWITEFEHQLYQ